MKSPCQSFFRTASLPLLALLLTTSFYLPASSQSVMPGDLTPSPSSSPSSSSSCSSPAPAAEASKSEKKANGSFRMPKGWINAGSHPHEYDMGIDETVKHNGAKCASIKSTAEKLHGFGTLMQMFDAGGFKGKRWRLTGFTKCSNVEGWAGMWMRVDGPDPKRSLAFYNMQDRPLKGTSDWAKQEIVLDVPENATNIAFGVLLNGAGQVWMDDFQFKQVGKNVPTNALKENSCVNKSPTNLNFQD